MIAPQSDHNWSTLKRVQSLASRFDVLKEWTFDVSNDMAGQVLVDTTTASATVYPWPLDDLPEPEDFILHEVLHCVFRAWATTRRGEARYEAEEQMVQDLCRYVRLAIKARRFIT